MGMREMEEGSINQNPRSGVGALRAATRFLGLCPNKTGYSDNFLLDHFEHYSDTFSLSLYKSFMILNSLMDVA